MKCPICDGSVEVTTTVPLDKNGKKTKKNPAKIKRYRKCAKCGKFKTTTFEKLDG